MAVVSIKGKQFIVNEGKEISVPHLNMEPGEKLNAKDLLTDEEVTLEVIGDKNGKKIRVVKFRNKTRYHRVIGQKVVSTLVKLVKKEETKKVNKKEAVKEDK